MKKLFALLMLFSCLSLEAASASTASPQDAEIMRNIIEELSEEQLRQFLTERLNQEISERRQANQESELTLGAEVSKAMSALVFFLKDVINKAPNIPSEVKKALNKFETSTKGGGWTAFFWSLLLSLGGGAIAAYGSALIFNNKRFPPREDKHLPLFLRVKLLLQRFLAQVSRAFAFFAAAYLINIIWNTNAPFERDAVSRLISAVSSTWFALILARFVLAPKRPDLRLCAVDSSTANRMTIGFVSVVAIFNFGYGFTSWLNYMGSIFENSWHGFWITVAYHTALISVVFWVRKGFVQILSSGAQDNTDGKSSLASAWPYITLTLIILHWFVVELFVANASVVPHLFFAMATTLSIIISLPFLDLAMRSTIREYFASNHETEAEIAAANNATVSGLIRVGRVLGCIILVFILLKSWQVDIINLAEFGVGAQFASTFLNSLAILAVSYGLWELIHIITERQISIEKAAAAKLASETEENDYSGARLGTFLPLVRFSSKIAIVIVTALAVLWEMGVNVLPIIASAGVAGIAIGFGAQALVRDVISGIFFLVDDAFRKDEYIDIGKCMGTVEKISIRSMRIRHETGLLHTVPFGEVNLVTNYSRDWGIMQIHIRVPFETDLVRLYKKINETGEELLKDPDIGHLFKHKLISQGAVRTEESAIVVRLAYMTKALEQWAMRGVVLAYIRDMFAREGFRFAGQDVTFRVVTEGNLDSTKKDGHELPIDVDLKSVEST